MPLIELVSFVKYKLLSSLFNYEKKRDSDLSIMVTVLTHRNVRKGC